MIYLSKARAYDGMVAYLTDQRDWCMRVATGATGTASGYWCGDRADLCDEILHSGQVALLDNGDRCTNPVCQLCEQPETD